MPLDNKQRKDLKAKSHHLKPVIRVGQKGVSESLLLETGQALEIHELIKVHIADDDREARKAVVLKIAEQTGAEVVNQIGKTCVLYRKKGQAETDS
jgi:RNA-binding protein